MPGQRSQAHGATPGDALARVTSWISKIRVGPLQLSIFCDSVQPLKTSWRIIILKSPLSFLKGAKQQETLQSPSSHPPSVQREGVGADSGEGGQQEPCTAARSPLPHRSTKHKLLPPPRGESWEWSANHSHQELIKHTILKQQQQKYPFPSPECSRIFGNSFLFHLI